MVALRDTSELLWPAVRATLASLDLKPEDDAAKKLAQRYAQVIDATPDARQEWAMRWIGPLLLDVLVQLQATPAARAQPGKPQQAPAPGEDHLAKIRAAKAGRRPKAQ